MKEPGRSTRIALFTLSGNTCAFPDCQAPMYEAGSIVGVVCHIHAQSPGGPRFNDQLKEEDVNGIDNLVLLCPTHHKVIDDQPELYDATSIRRMKAEHESRATPLPGDFLRRLIDSLVEDVPAEWWERPGAPEFRFSLASSRPPGVAWEFNFGVQQIDGGDIGKLRYRYRHGEDEGELKEADKRKQRKWRLDSITVQPRGEAFAIELRFWWAGAERSLAQRWETEDKFQSAEWETLCS